MGKKSMWCNGASGYIYPTGHGCGDTVPHYHPAPEPIPIPKKPPKRVGESDVLRRIREAVGAIDGVTLWRNNTGMLEDRNGTKVRFGLCEGSADLVGIVEVPGDHEAWPPGPKTIGRFIAIEVKKPGKKPTKEQLAFLELVTKMGGYACWVTSVDEAVAHVRWARCL